MDKLLKVDAGVAECANNNVATRTSIGWNVPAGIGNLDVPGVVDRADLSACARNNLSSKMRRRLYVAARPPNRDMPGIESKDRIVAGNADGHCDHEQCLNCRSNWKSLTHDNVQALGASTKTSQTNLAQPG